MGGDRGGLRPWPEPQSLQLANCWQTRQTIPIRNTSQSLSSDHFKMGRLENGENGKAQGFNYGANLISEFLAFKSFACVSIY